MRRQGARRTDRADSPPVAGPAHPTWPDEHEIKPRLGSRGRRATIERSNAKPSYGVEAIDAIIQSFWDEGRAVDGQERLSSIVRPSDGLNDVAAPDPTRGLAPPAVASAGSNHPRAEGFVPTGAVQLRRGSPDWRSHSQSHRQKQTRAGCSSGVPGRRDDGARVGSSAAMASHDRCGADRRADGFWQARQSQFASPPNSIRRPIR